MTDLVINLFMVILLMVMDLLRFNEPCKSYRGLTVDYKYLRDLMESNYAHSLGLQQCAH